jgi:hypothetical protein
LIASCTPNPLFTQWKADILNQIDPNKTVQKVERKQPMRRPQSCPSLELFTYADAKSASRKKTIRHMNSTGESNLKQVIKEDMKSPTTKMTDLRQLTIYLD